VGVSNYTIDEFHKILSELADREEPVVVRTNSINYLLMGWLSLEIGERCDHCDEFRTSLRSDKGTCECLTYWINHQPTAWTVAVWR
jgi:hypothetical protein